MPASVPNLLFLHVLVVLFCATADGFVASPLQASDCLLSTRSALGRSIFQVTSSSDDGDDEDFSIEVDTSQFRRGKKAAQFSLKSRGSGTNRKSLGAGKSSGSTTVHVCTNCGAESVKWMGRCGTCSSWGTLVEEEVRGPPRDNSKGVADHTRHLFPDFFYTNPTSPPTIAKNKIKRPHKNKT
jgi:hypothetical protein